MSAMHQNLSGLGNTAGTFSPPRCPDLAYFHRPTGHGGCDL